MNVKYSVLLEFLHKTIPKTAVLKLLFEKLQNGVDKIKKG